MKSCRALLMLSLLALAAPGRGLAQTAAPQPEGCAFELAGIWLGSNGVRYDVGQQGMSFSWAAGALNERATGACRGAALNVRWQGGLGAGSAQGRVQSSRGNVALGLAWSNGVTFRRVPKLTLRGAPAAIRAGDTVQFSLQLDPPGVPGFRYSIQFGDGQSAAFTEPPAAIPHVYSQPGSYSALALPEPGEGKFASNTVAIEAGNAAPPASLRLRIDQSECLTGEPIQLRAVLEPEVPGAQFRFVFGQQVTPWSDQPEARLTCSQEGVWRAQAAAALGTPAAAAYRRILQSAPIEVRVQTLRVTLQALSSLALVGIPARFEAQTAPTADDLQYSFSFGDEPPTAWLSEAAVSHSFQRPGTYQVVAHAKSEGVAAISAPVAFSVVQLVFGASPLRPKPGQAVRFTVRPNPPLPGLEYRFAFGEGKAFGWTPQPGAIHTYSGAGSYSAFVEVRLGQSAPLQAAPIRLVVAQAAVIPPPARPVPGGLPSPVRVPWLVLASALAVLGAAYVVLRQRRGRGRSKVQARLAFAPHPDSGRQWMEAGRAPGIRTEVQLRPVGDPGRQSAVIAPTVKKGEAP